MTPRAQSLAVRAYLRYLKTTKGPIILGPFRSELGFEVLYWTPFLNWALKYAGIQKERCIALSRGGMGHLYPAAHQVDLYALRGVDAVRLENQVDIQTRKILKQTTITAWDKSVAREAVERVHKAGTRFHWIHPSWMYWLFDGFWNEQVTYPHIAKHTRFDPLPMPSLPNGMTLPEKFVAVRFYERATLPLQPDIKVVLKEMVQRIAQHRPVVVLSQPHFVDDHVDLPLKGDNIFLLPTVAPEENLLLQAAVLARSEAFVGTYGGVAQWALRYKKPSLSVYAHFGGTAMAHRMLSHLLSAQMKVPFEVMELSALKLWQAALGPLVEQKPQTQEPAA